MPSVVVEGVVWVGAVVTGWGVHAECSGSGGRSRCSKAGGAVAACCGLVCVAWCHFHAQAAHARRGICLPTYFHTVRSQVIPIPFSMP